MRLSILVMVLVCASATMHGISEQPAKADREAALDDAAAVVTAQSLIDKSNELYMISLRLSSIALQGPSQETLAAANEIMGDTLTRMEKLNAEALTTYKKLASNEKLTANEKLVANATLESILSQIKKLSVNSTD